MNIIKNLVTSNKYKIKCPYSLTPEYITIHNTANDASAKNEINYMINNDKEVSFHFAVDDKEIVQGLPLDRNAWHAGDGGNGTGNRKSLAIEICYSKSGGERFLEAEKNAAKLTAELLTKYNLTIDKVKKHADWSSKNCPHRTIELDWNRFINLIKEELNTRNKETDTTINVYYRVKTKKHGWLGEIKNYSNDPVKGYAGWENSPITGLAIKVDKGSIKYRVHLKNKGWLNWITDYNINDIKQGYAGNSKDTIDAIQIYYYTPSNIRPYKKAKYKANNYGWQYDTETTKGQDGYAGIIGTPITKLQIIIN